MAKLDTDVRNLINHLYFEVSDTWQRMMGFLWSPDTRPDAAEWIQVKSDPNEVELKKEISTKSWLPDVQRVIKSAAKGFDCTLSVDNAAPGNIMKQVWQDIRRSDVILADLTEQNPNVFYEMGLAHALGKPTIMIKQKNTGAVPFDVRNYKYGEYDTQNLGPLQAWLVDAFRAVPQRYRFDPAPPSGR